MLFSCKRWMLLVKKKRCLLSYIPEMLEDKKVDLCVDTPFKKIDLCVDKTNVLIPPLLQPPCQLLIHILIDHISISARPQRMALLSLNNLLPPFQNIWCF